MRLAFVLLLSMHGLVHMLGFAKGVGLEVPELRGPISSLQGFLWLTAGLLFLGGAALLLLAPRFWWIPVAAGLVLSQTLIFSAWSDARFGTIANLLILIPLALTVADLRPSSLRSQYEAAAERALAATPQAEEVITEADLAALPEPVAMYLRRSGMVGEPRVHSFHAVFDARIRQGPDSPWMSGTAEQYEFFDPTLRLFFMKAWRTGLPVDVYHRYAGSHATMRGRLLGLFEILDVSGPELTRSETVTLLNDMVFLAPGALLDAPIDWEPVDEHRVRATYRNAGHTVSAVIHFDEAGDLVDFESDDRYRSDGESHVLDRWSTPFFEPAEYGPARLPAGGEARWGEPGEEWTYGVFELRSIRYNP
jgi:hypothetical protein